MQADEEVLSVQDSDAELAQFSAAQHPRIVRFLTMHTGDLLVAQELAQEAMVRLCQHWPQVRRMDQPQAWLTRVAVNLSLSRFRRRQAERRALARQGDEESNPARYDSDSDTRLSVRAALADLPTRQRTAVLLRYLADMSVRETAIAMDCAEGTVKSLTSKGLAALARNRNIAPQDCLSQEKPS